ncbi:hypothetical protein [Photobacterium carnosum]|uniref:hypothetical protein n=1 Tax=Photobacterium carnosum TaxID=2023717 RepID=UPI001E42A309|nr:hypothetical protein [Photobacterium carnosum]MCD9514008.1 hypothetical protein [Photobacterium carnosum]
MNKDNFIRIVREMGLKPRFSPIYGNGWQKGIIENESRLRFGEAKFFNGQMTNCKFGQPASCDAPVDTDDYYCFAWYHMEWHGEILSINQFDYLRKKAEMMHVNDKESKLATRADTEREDLRVSKKIKKRSKIKGRSARSFLCDLIKNLPEV